MRYTDGAGVAERVRRVRLVVAVARQVGARAVRRRVQQRPAARHGRVQLAGRHRRHRRRRRRRAAQRRRWRPATDQFSYLFSFIKLHRRQQLIEISFFVTCSPTKLHISR